MDFKKPYKKGVIQHGAALALWQVKVTMIEVSPGGAAFSSLGVREKAGLGDKFRE